MPRTTVLVPYDRLSRRHGALTHLDARTHDVLIVDSARMHASQPWGAQRLLFLHSCVAHLAAELEAQGITVHRMNADTVADGVRAHMAATGSAVTCTRPSSFALERALTQAGVTFDDDTGFLTSRTEFAQWVGGQRSLRMESFYRWQRTRLDVLMDGDQPVGGTWNLDAENRLPPPRGAHDWPEPLTHERDAVDDAVAAELATRGLIPAGARLNSSWATTRDGAVRQLEHFIEHVLPQFGPYEDAMPRGTWSVHHSLLSPYLNVGLIDPDEVVAAAERRFARGDVPLASMEGFIRQVIGWREYVHGLYWHLGPSYREHNALAADRPLLPVLTEPSRSQMACVTSIVADIDERGWVHHIPRLMVLSNLALLTGVVPQEFLDWMRRVFIDAHEWVMVPNVIGMGLHADGGQMMTKPYAAGGAYISRMGQYCGDCRYDPKRRTGDDACPFTTLYWDFLDRHRERFLRNHRMATQVRGLDRLADLEAVRERAVVVRDGLERDTV